jgi:hypothetical protein
MVMVVMMVMAMRGKSRRRDREQQRGDNNKLLHGKNVARANFAGHEKSTPAPYNQRTPPAGLKLEKA